ncbi:MAG: hypothetical protein ACHQNA_00745, partial [Acidimicrobiales bacterium]
MGLLDVRTMHRQIQNTLSCSDEGRCQQDTLLHESGSEEQWRMVEFRGRLERIARERPAVIVAFDPDGTPVSAAQLLAKANVVRGAVGHTAGRVAVRGFNTVDGLAAVHGIWLAGRSAVLVSPLTPPAEAERRIEATGASMLVTPAPQPEVEPRGGHITGSDVEAAVIFTSGTTGTAKA